MPRKIRELRAAGFVEDRTRGKGSHRYRMHPAKRPAIRVVLSGASGDDARHNQEQTVRHAIEMASRPPIEHGRR